MEKRPDNCGLKNDNSETRSTPAGASIGNYRMQVNEHSGGADADSDNDSWDDAKALLINDNDEHNNDGTMDKNFDDHNNLATELGYRTSSQQWDPPNDTIDDPATANRLTTSSSSHSSPHSTRKVITAPMLDSGVEQKAFGTEAAVSDGGLSNDDGLILHEAVFNNDTEKISRIINDAELVRRLDLVNKRDKHGNTALHLACMMGRSPSAISAFLQNQHGFEWSINVKNLNRWTPFHEACSYGNREVITLIARQLKDEIDKALQTTKLTDFFEKTRNFRLVLKWEFQSWVPFVTRVLPSDVCEIIKQDKSIRIDTRLLDLESIFKRKGDSCLLYTNNKWIFLNNKTKKYQYFETPSVYKEIDEKVDEFMSTDLMDLELKSSDMQLTRSTSGWIWKADKLGKVGRFNAALYDLNNVFLVTRKRREHLDDDDLKRNKSAYRSAINMFKFGDRASPTVEGGAGRERNSSHASEEQGDGGYGAEDGNDDDDDDGEDEIIHRESLPPPPPTTASWKEYLQAEPGNPPTLGREQKCKVVKTAVKASVAMSEEFPLSKKEFLDLLSIVPIKLFKKLKEFVELKLPDGFPIRLDIPIFPFLSARITFTDFAFFDGLVDKSLFTIPPDYEYDSNLFPGHLRNRNNSNNNSNSNSLGNDDS